MLLSHAFGVYLKKNGHERPLSPTGCCISVRIQRLTYLVYLYTYLECDELVIKTSVVLSRAFPTAYEGSIIEK